MFAANFAGAIETFDADVIERDAAVHRRADRRLGDDEKFWLIEKRADLGSHDQRFVPALQCACLV